MDRLLAVKAPGAELRWPGRSLRLADGTCVSQPGSTGTDWRIHGVFDLGRGGFSHLELTDQHAGETLARGAPLAGEIRIGDRNYARASALRRFRAGHLRRQQPLHHGGEEPRRLVQPILDRGIAEFGDPPQRRPGRRLAQRQPARTPRQRDPQQASAVHHLAPTLDRLRLQRQRVEVETGRKARQKLRELVVQGRSWIRHPSSESDHAASGQELF